MTLKEKIAAESGKRTYKTITHPILGEVTIRSLSEREWQTGVHRWFYDSSWNRIPERAAYDNVKLIQMSLVDESLNLVYGESFEDLDVLVELREEITKPLFDAVRDFNRPELPKN